MPSRKRPAARPVAAFRHVTVLAAFLACFPAGAEERPSLTCDVGPVMKTFGKTSWLVYSCNDERSLVLVAAPGSPASPFYFIFAAQGEGYKVHGEGTGDKKATSAAYEDLKTLGASDVQSLVAQTRAMQRDSKISVETLGEGHYRLTLKKPQSVPFQVGQMELAPTAKKLCPGGGFEFGHYTFESNEQIDAKPGAGKKDFFQLRQEIHCVVAGTEDARPTGAKPPVVKDDRLIERLTLQYFRAKDGGAYRDAYASLTDSMQGMTSFEQWQKTARAFNARAGKSKSRQVVKITWYQDPPSAAPGLYAAADFSSAFERIEIHCGYVVWRQEADGSFRLSREEENFLDNKVRDSLDADKLATARAKFGVGCR